MYVNLLISQAAIIAIVVAVVVVIAAAVVLLFLLRKKKIKKESITDAELIDKSRELIKKNYKKCTSYIDLYSDRLSENATDELKIIEKTLNYCSPSIKDTIYDLDTDISSKLDDLRLELSNVEYNDSNVKSIIFDLKDMLAKRSIDI